MKRGLVSCLTWLLSLPALAGAAELAAGGTTLLQIEERESPGFGTERLVPATQFLGLDAGGLADGNLSFHFYGWGRQDLADKSFNDNRTEGDFSYGYLRYRFPKASADLRLGRLLVTEGIAKEQLDGVSARADLAHGFSAALFMGSPVRQQNDNSGDFIAGGRVAYRKAGLLELGASAVYQDGTDSQRFQPAFPPFSIVAHSRQLVGGDLWLAPLNNLEITGRTSYNTATSSLAEHNYLLQYKVLKNLSVAGLYLQRNYEGYFSGTNVPLIFRPDTQDDSWQAGGSVSYAVSAPLELSADYRHINRKSLGDTDKFGADARLDLKKIALKAGLGYHRIAAPAIPGTRFDLSYHELHGWAFYDKGRYRGSLDITADLYDDKDNPNLNGVSNDFEAVASAGYRLLPSLSVSGDLAYGYSALLSNYWRGLLRAEFALDTVTKGGKK